MNSIILNFKKNKSLKFLLLFLFVFILINIFVYYLPKDYSRDLYEDAISYKKDKPSKNYFVKDIKAVAFGDSKATQAAKNFFNVPTLSLAAPNNTIIFSKFIFDQLKSNPLFKPEFVILYIGPNNFNKNGLFTKRDYAIRQLSSFLELLRMFKMDDGFEYAIDGLISKLIPIYGRRIEIRHPLNFWKLMQKNENDISKIPGMYDIFNVKYNKVERDHTLDKNYTLIYERSVYNNFILSKFHTNYLENMIEDIIELGAKPILVQLPIDNAMQKLRERLVQNEFDKYLLKIKKKYNFFYIDQVKSGNYQFLDINHLTAYGHKKFIEENINPIMKKNYF